MPKPIVILTPTEVASHVSDHSYKWDKGATSGNWLVLIDSKAKYGYMEHDGIDQGGLWFDDSDILTDYDGRAILPRRVADIIEALGLHIDPFDKRGMLEDWAYITRVDNGCTCG